MTTLTDMHTHPVLLIPDQLLLPDGAVTRHAVRVENGTITDVAPLARFDGADIARVELHDQLLMPGFIDAHTHLTQSFGKALVFGEPSEIFKRIWVPMERFMDAEAIALATQLAAWECLRGGFTTVADAGTRASVDVKILADAAGTVGLRCVLGVICNDLRDGVPVMNRQEVMQLAQNHLQRWDQAPLVHPSLAISIPEVASDETLTAVAHLAREAGVPFQTHLNEHLAAVERSLVATGMRPLERLAHLDALGPELLAAHATLLTTHEIMLLRDSGGAISYNPVASSWKGNAVAPALLLHDLGVRQGLGTDGTRSDAFRLLDAAETGQRFAHTMATGDSSSGGGWRWLDMGLAGGADAVGLAGRIGTIAPGTLADLLVVDLSGPEFAPSWDLDWELVRLANRDQIRAVIVGGRLRLQDGMPVDWDGPTLLQQVRELAKRIVTSAPIQQIDPSAGAHRAAWKKARRA